MALLKDITRLRIVELLRELLTFESQATGSFSVPAGQGGYPEDGFDTTGRARHGFKVTTTGACTIYLQGRDSIGDVWTTLQKKETDADVSWTLDATKQKWVTTDAPAKYARLWVNNTSGGAITMTINYGGGP